MLVIGVGNRFRGDDAAGIRVAEKLRAKALPTLRVLEREGDLSSLLDAWTGERAVVLVDATRSGAPAGTVRRFDAAAGALPALFAQGSTHLLGVAEAVELARALGGLPPSLVVFGIEGASFEAGEALSPAVAAAVDAVAEAVAEEAKSHA